ncbi:MAG TPA: MBOAT family O-acyltransferase [Terracidiphilus sp.]|nr:MBOAT family O-acyltransferase [Terracidiphilus sp.]
MSFNSFVFLGLFLPVVAGGYAALRRYRGARAAQVFLLLSSLFFYGYAKPPYVLLLLGSITFNWAIAAAMGPAEGVTPAQETSRKFNLRIGLTGNVLLLGCFKYINFFLLHFPNIHGVKLALPDWSFPLGISFFTLTQVMYLVDTYQGLNAPNSFFDHATLVSLFPYVASGPLVRSRAVVPQFKTLTASSDRMDLACRGLLIFAIGLAKKVVLADSFARIADAGFGSAHRFSTLEAWIFSLAYTFQIYFDFSGYSDMAVGTAWMLGIDIPKNFNAPYISKSISEFWQRWHISLSNFITSYLFTPILRAMGKATLKTSVVAVLLAMAIAGLWHGPAWTFVLFGVLHGVALAANQIWKKKKLKMPDWLGWIVTFVFVNMTFVFFRSPNVPFALHLLHSMLPHAGLLGTSALKGVLPITPVLIVRPVAIGIVLAFFFRTSQDIAKHSTLNYRSMMVTALLFGLSIFYMNSTVAKEFVYFAF